MSGQKQRTRPIAESLELRMLLTSTSPLLQYDFNSASPWPNMVGTTTNGGTAALVWGGFGTIDNEGGTAPSNAVRLTATPPTSGAWTSDLSSGELAVTNTETNLGKLTLSFNLSVSQLVPVKVKIFSYTAATGSPSGGLEAYIYPASTYYNQRFAIDLSTMTASGPGTFNPTAPYVSFDYVIDSSNGWSAATAAQLRLDNVNYSKPAYYVSPAGNNTTGLTEATAFHTPQQAVNISQPGDIILLMTGTYNEITANTGAIHFSTGGTPADWLTVKNYPGQSPEIYNEAWNAVSIGNGSSSNIATTPAVAYVEVRGLHIVGDAQIANTTYVSDLNQAQPQTNGNGLTVDGRFETNHPHDIRFADNLVEYNSGGGISVQDADRIQIENNVSRYNAWWCIYAPSGISVFSAYNFDGTTNNVTRLVRNNTTYGNQTFLVWNSLTPPNFSDGNGIIIDNNHNTQYLPNSVCAGRTLVTDNVSFDNGGSGIHETGAYHVDIVNNTAYMNSASPHLQYGEIFASGTSSDIRIYNNILVAPVAAAGQPAEPVNSGSSSYFQNNIYFGGNTTPVMGSGDRFLNPQLIDPTIDPATANFGLLSTSPAINSGGTALAPYLDYAGNVRTGLPDIGAYEYYAFSTPIPTAANAAPREDTGTTTSLNIVAGNDLGPAPYTYSWATTSKPSGAVNPAISPSSGSGLSNVSTATFTSSGAYTFTLTITDANATVTTYPVSVTVFLSTTGISVSPTPRAVAVGTTQQFTGNVTDQFGKPLSRNLTWATNTSAGTISTSGLYTASQTPGSYSVTAFNNGVTGTAAVTVVPTTYTTSGAGYYVRLAPDAVTEQIWVGTPGSVGPSFNATPTYSILLASLPSLKFGPATGAEALTIDLVNGKPIPTGGLSFDGGSGADSLNILGSTGDDSVTFNATQIMFGPTPITYANIESISVNLAAGNDSLTQSAQPGNFATLTLVSPTATDSLVVSSGTFTVPAATLGITRVSLGSLNISSGAKVVLTPATLHTTRNVLAIENLTLAPTATLDLGGNDLIVTSTASNLTGDILSGLNPGVALWTGTGLTTSAPVGNALRAIGFLVATAGQSFDNQFANAGDTLIKTTYFGDANLDGNVDGSDYTRIDSGFLTNATGWSNGDFNYDGIINGSDYTLIDNSFNTQGATLAAKISAPVGHLPKVTATPTAVADSAPSDSAPDNQTNKQRKHSLAQELEQITVF